MVLGLSRALTGLLALIMPARSESVTLERELCYISCQPGGRVLVYFKTNSGHSAWNCWEETITPLASSFLKSCEDVLYELRGPLLEREAFSFEVRD